MPDMQTALGKALEEGKRKFLSTTLNEWDAHEQQIRQPQPSKQPQEKTMTVLQDQPRNMRIDAFDLIKRAPNKYTLKTATDVLVDMGYKPGSVHTSLIQMKKAGMLEADANGHLYTITERYVPFANPYVTTKKRTTKASKARTSAKGAGIAALTTQDAAPQAQPARLVIPMTAEKVLASIGVAEAHKLYVELGKMFGGK